MVHVHFPGAKNPGFHHDFLNGTTWAQTWRTITWACMAWKVLASKNPTEPFDCTGLSSVCEMSLEDPIPTGPPPSDPLLPSSCSRAASLARRKIRLPGHRETTGHWEVMVEGGSYHTLRTLKNQHWGLDQDSRPQSALPWGKMRKKTPCFRNADTKEMAIDVFLSPPQATSGLDLGSGPTGCP